MITGARALPFFVEEASRIYDRQMLADGLALLIKLFENIENNPVEFKFRNVKKSNPTLVAKLFAFKGLERIFGALGFVEDGEFYRFTHQDITPIRQAVILLRAQEVGLRVPVSHDPEAAQRIAKIQEDMRKKEEEKRRIQESMKQDRQEKREDFRNHPIQSSKAKELKFGSKLITQQDMNPSCNEPSG